MKMTLDNDEVPGARPATRRAQLQDQPAARRAAVRERIDSWRARRTRRGPGIKR